MTFNWLALPTLGIAWLLFWMGNALSRRWQSRAAVGIMLGVALVAAVPGVLMAAYYLHWFDCWQLFYDFRAMRGSELAAAGAGLLGGILAYRLGRLGVRPILCWAGLGVLLTVGIFVPYVKPVLAPAQFDQLRDSWDGVVCRQSTGYSCGAACAATILRYNGLPATELELARECFTYGSGTENWYIARALRKRGLDVSFFTQVPEDGLPVPCIAGVRIGEVGHFITIIEERGESYLVGDPMVGERLHAKATIFEDLAFTGFFMKAVRNQG